jgi:Ca-activated chloride channel family protein
MKDQRTPETEMLYARGLEQFRTAQWAAAAQTLAELRAITRAYPEIDVLLADVLLKVEIERAHTPDGLAPPKRHWLLHPRFLTAVLVLLLIGGALLIAMRPSPPPEQEINTVARPVGALPTPAPTNTPQPTATPLPTNTPQPTATPLPTATPAPTTIPEPGTLQVRMAEGQSLVRTTANIEIILDASGSMSGKIDGRRKIDIAHESLAALVNKLPDTTKVALRSYGHRKGSDCNDIELLTPLGPLDRGALTARINSINPSPNGMTPIGASLQQVAEDLKGAQGDILVVLVSDGDETCSGDPAVVAAQVHASNPKIKFDVIGFNVGPEAWRARLNGVAQGGGGSYFDAVNATQLVDALQQAVALTYRVLDSQRQEVYQGALGSSTTLPAGRYTVEISGESPLTIGDISVGGGQPALLELREQDGKLNGEIVPAK